MNPDPCRPPVDPRTTLHLIRSRIATAALGPSAVTGEGHLTPSARLGRITLRPHQVDAVLRLRAILDRHHGALLADEVGLGKTFVALAVAQQYQQVHVVAPATLREMWEAARAMAELPHVTVHGLPAFSRPDPPTWPILPGTLVIIDEAHALRHRHTDRYRAVARAVTGCDVLCISATPIHNRAAELAALFALFRSQEARRTTRPLREALIVRRRGLPVTPGAPPDESGKPAVVHAPARVVPQDPGTLARIVSLPDPLPARDGATAGALIRLGLLRAWCSSDAALTQTIRRRRLRGAALCDALRAGHRPTRHELRTWVVGDDEGQLAFPELLAAAEPESASLLTRLERHLEALQALAAHHARTAGADAARAELLRELLDRHGDTPIVAFSQQARTVEALYRALRDIAGVGLVTGRQGRIASGPIPRAALLHAFAPRAHGRAPPPPTQRVRLLLATDLLAEGVNLQDAGVVVHLDLPWTDALRRQREGRCARLGSPHPTVTVYRIRAPLAARALDQTRRLLAKRRAATLVSGHGTPGGASHPEVVSAWRKRLQRWVGEPSAMSPARATIGGIPGVTRDDPEAPVPIMRQRCRSGYALVVLRPHASEPDVATADPLSGGREARLLVLRTMRQRSDTTATTSPTESAPRPWRVTSNRRVALRAVATSQRAGDVGIPLAADDRWRQELVAIRRAIRRWGHARRARRVTGHQSTSMAHRAAWLALDTAWESLDRFDRIRLASAVTAARRCVQHVRGVGAETALRAWCVQREQQPPAAWLQGWMEHPALAVSTGHSIRRPATGGCRRWQWHAALLLGPD